MPRCELPIKFNDCDDLIVLKTPELIKKFPILTRAIECHDCDWEEKDTIIKDAVLIPFARRTGDFLLKHVDSYQAPITLVSRGSDYPEADALDLDELKELIELAGYLECTTMVKVAALCIAGKLEGLDMQIIADFFGGQHTPNTFFHENQGWQQVHREAEDGGNA